MAKARKPAKSSPQSDVRFEEFLQSQFKQLRAELDRFEPSRKGVEGKLMQMPQARASASTFWHKLDSWRYGIAATVLLAVAIPTMIQLNREERSAVMQATGSVADKNTERKPQPSATLQADDDEREEADESTAVSARKQSAAPRTPSKKTAPTKEFAKVQNEKDASGDMSKRELPDDMMAAADAPAAAKGRSFTSEGEASPAAESPRVAPAAPAAPRVAEERAEEKSAANAASRSAPIPDAQFRLKQDRIAEEEKAEMEKLWKEFEKDPKAFQKDQKRSARLRTLLARHDTKSRARRMKAELTQ